jgi:hypothetical protein
MRLIIDFLCLILSLCACLSLPFLLFYTHRQTHTLQKITNNKERCFDNTYSGDTSLKV